MTNRDKIIFHVDCNAFFASVEETLHPELKKVPMAVCGNPESRRGIILAKNELAKQYGIKTAETIWQAKQKCPQLVLASARHGLYSECSEKINRIYAQYTDLVERFGIDESYLDVTGSLHLFGGNAERLANEIRQRVKKETDLTVSVGVSFNKIFAKLGSDYKKPDAVTIISRENFREIVWPLPASDLFLVGKATNEILLRSGVKTIGDIAKSGEEWLSARLGKLGEQLFLYANGEDISPVMKADEQTDVKSVGNSITFKRDLISEKDVKTAVTALSDMVASRLRKSGLKCLGIQVSIKDIRLKVITRQSALNESTWIASEIAEQALKLIENTWEKQKPIRMLAVTAQRLVSSDFSMNQLSFFDEPKNIENKKKKEELEKAMDVIRNKYGRKSIVHGSIIDNELGLERED